MTNNDFPNAFNYVNRAVDSTEKDAEIARLTSRLAEAEAALATERERVATLTKERADDKVTRMMQCEAVDKAERALAAAVARAEKAEAAEVEANGKTARHFERLNAALAKLRALELDDCPQADMDCPLSEKYDEEIRALHDQLDAAIAATYSRAVEEFAEMLLNEGVVLDYGSNTGRESPTDAAVRYLAQAGKEPRHD